MDAMSYEWLLRRVYNSGRNYDSGADADVYRKMERASHALNMPQIRKPEDAQYEYRRAFAAVRGNVRQGLLEGLKQIGYRAEDSEVKRLQEMTEKLSWDFYDKEALDKIIKEADAVFHKYGLQGR